MTQSSKDNETRIRELEEENGRLIDAIVDQQGDIDTLFDRNRKLSRYISELGATVRTMETYLTELSAALNK